MFISGLWSPRRPEADSWLTQKLETCRNCLDMHVYFFLKTRSTIAFKDSSRNVQPGEKNEKTKELLHWGPPSSQRVNAAFTNCHLRGPICSGTTRHRQTGPYWQAALSRHGWLAASSLRWAACPGCGTSLPPIPSRGHYLPTGGGGADVHA